MLELTPIINLLEQGDPAAFLPLLYDDLRRLTSVKLRQEPAGPRWGWEPSGEQRTQAFSLAYRIATLQA